MPLAHKDIFVTRDFPSTAGSRMLAGYRSPFDATVVARLAQQGAVTLGKLNCDEFAMGSANENTAIAAIGHDKAGTGAQPLEHRPYPGRFVGGQRGGGGGAADAGQHRHRHGWLDPPAGIVLRHHRHQADLRPRVALRHDRVCLQPGPGWADGAQRRRLCRAAQPHVRPDPDRDSTSLDLPPQDFSQTLHDSIDGLRIGVPAEFFGAGVSDDVRAAIDSALREYDRLGAVRVPVSLPRTELSIPVYYIIAPAEASSNLSRFDGVKFGHRAAQFKDLADMYRKTRSEGFGDEVRRRIMIGTYVLSHGYYDAYYLQAQKIRRMLSDDFQQAFAHCDVIAGPVAPTVAWRIGEKSDDPLANYLADIFTLPASLAGLPAMSLPVGFGAAGLPIGLQLMGNYLQEGRLLNLAHRFQQVTDFHTRKPQGY